MSLKPCPVPLARQIRSTRSVVVHRQLDCRFYDACLDRSVQMKWESFSCIRCPVRATADRPSDAAAFAQKRLGPPALCRARPPPPRRFNPGRTFAARQPGGGR